MSASGGPRLAQLVSSAAARWPSADRAVRRMLRALRQRSAPKSPREYLKTVGRIRQVTSNGHTYAFVCPNRTVSWRVTTFLTKEPETIEWIDTFSPGDVLFDIGANIGLYSIYAASRNIRVRAFEPESQNYALINQNIFLNGYGDRIACNAFGMESQPGASFRRQARGGADGTVYRKGGRDGRASIAG